MSGYDPDFLTDDRLALLRETQVERELAAENQAPPQPSSQLYTGRVESATSAGWGGSNASRALSAGSRGVPRLDPAALYGLPAYWAEAVQPYTEAAPIGIVVSTLVAFGSAAGGSPYITVGPTRHHANEFAILVGPTATGRKGEAARIGMRPIRLADDEWSERVARGFGSGESLVEAVSDESEDRRLLVFEDEFALTLTVAARKGSTISGLLRSAWDGSKLENRTKGHRLVASNAHISFLAGITPDELRRLVMATEVANGFLNRFLLVAVQRTQLLPSPPPIPGNVEDEYVAAFKSALRFARHCGSGFARDGEAEELWQLAYRDELSVDRWGLSGAACSRAEAHTLRLSLLFALLDESRTIRAPHVEAALAIWRYAEQSARSLFRERIGHPVADRALEALKASEGGLTKTELRDGEFSRHVDAEDLTEALELLVGAGLATEEKLETGGRPALHYRATELATDERRRT